MTRGFRYFACSTLNVLAVVAGALGQQAADPYKEALRYAFDKPRTGVLAIETEIRAAKPEQLRIIEGKLLQILQSLEATTDAKAWVCRQLRQAGSERSIDALATLLADQELATVARFALQSMPGPKADEALRGAISRLTGDRLAGVIQTIGVRGDRQALALLVPTASDKDPGVAEAALFALGHIGGAEALRAVQQAKVPDCLNRARCHAILLCAERMAADGQTAEAAAAYQALYTKAKDVVVRTSALGGIVLCDKAKAAPTLVSALKDDRPRLRAAAAKFVCELGSKDMLASVLADLPALPSDSQVMILTMVADKTALPAVLKATKSSNSAVRWAAVGALGRVGDASCVPLLLSIDAAEKGHDARTDARMSLRELRGTEVAAALLAAAQDGKLTERMAAIRALAARGQVDSVPMLLKIAEGSDVVLQGESLVALAILGDQRALPALVELLVRAKEKGPRVLAERAVLATCLRIEDKNVAAGIVASGFANRSVAVRRSVIHVLANVPSAKSLEALRAAVNDIDAEVRDIAIRGLAACPDPAAAADLLAIARSGKHPTHRIIALRGAVRLTNPANKLPAEQAVKLLTEAMSLADRAEEKKLILAALGEAKHPAAINVASKFLSDPALEVEAAAAVVKIAKSLRATNPDAAAAAIQKVLDVCKSPAARQSAESAMVVLGGLVNIAPQGIATSPDGLDKDGTAGDDQAGIDGDPATYWDESDDQKLYRFVVTFKQPEKIAAISITGYEHHQYAPKDFDILCDGKAVKKMDNAQYDNNFLLVRLDEVTCTSVELKITGYYGRSPAIRELGIYRAKTLK